MIRRLAIVVPMLLVSMLLVSVMAVNQCEANFEKPPLVSFEKPSRVTIGFTKPTGDLTVIDKPPVVGFQMPSRVIIEFVKPTGNLTTIHKPPLVGFERPAWAEDFEKLPLRTQTQIIEDITPEEAFILIQNNKGNQSFVIIDIRTAEEYASEHIENTTNLDFYSETFREELDKLDKNKTYLIYCRTGRRTAIARGIMEELGFREVYNMLGGITQWEAKGLPTLR